MKNLAFLVALVLCLSLVLGCHPKKDERRGYSDDSKIGTGQDPMDGALGAPLRAKREAEIMTFLYSVNQLIQTEALTGEKMPKDLEEVKALWKRGSGRDWPPPVFRYKYTYDPRTGTVGEVHKTPAEYTPEEAAGGKRE